MFVEMNVSDFADFKKVPCENDYCQSLENVPNVLKIGWLIRCECCGNSISEYKFSSYEVKK